MITLQNIASRQSVTLQALGALAKEVVAETLWPTRCVLCDTPGPLICDDCRMTLPLIDQCNACPQCGAPLGRIQCCECNDVRLHAFGFTQFPLDGIRSAYAFTDSVGSIVRIWKDSGEQRLGPWMASMMAHHVEPAWIAHVPTLTAIPSTKSARARRGVDHGYVLARELAKVLDAPCTHLLQRPHAQDQRKLGRQDRLSNMQGTFSLKPSLMMPEAVLIVDDVCTTGATLYGAACALKAGGVKHVWGITFARVM